MSEKRRRLTSDFQIDDINEPFTFKPNTFDLVQSRMVAGGVNKGRWPSYVQDVKRCVAQSFICGRPSP